MKMKRVVVYIEESLYRLLKSLLASKGESVSGWFRKTVERLVRNKD